MATKLDYHFYASTVANWATADTRAEAIARVLKEGKGIFNPNEEGGMFVFSCKVALPKDAAYQISNYAPVAKYDSVIQGSFKMHKKSVIKLEKIED